MRDQQRHEVKLGDCLDLFASMPDNSVDLVIGSPPYAEKGQRYGDKSTKWRTDDWVAWMIEVTTAAVRVSRGHVVWVVNSAVRQGRYLPAVEGLVWEGYKAGLIGERSCIWHKNAPPSRKDWFGNDWEPVVVFKSATKGLPFDWESIATPPKYTSGGDFRQRGTDGKRRKGGTYPKGKLTRPRDVFRVTVGGGHLGSPLAHENEAPYPEGIVRPFVLACCPRDGIVLDPFSGSGTTGAVAIKNDRRYIGFESRKSQVELTLKRIAEVSR